MIIRIKDLLPSNYIEVKTNNLHMFSSKPNDTTFFNMTSDASTGFMVCGLGIKTVNDQINFMNTADWKGILNGSIENTRKLNGHFTGIKWTSGSTILFTDVLGLREMYLAEIDGTLIFSTHLNWITKISGYCDVDFKQFGAVWNSFNQISHKNVISKMQRLGPGSIAVLDNTTVHYDRKPWLPDSSLSASPEQLKDKINKFTLFPLANNRSISLGLSGGIDSRVLIKILSSQPNDNWSLHTFGDPGHPDIRIAGEICKKLHKELVVLNTDLPDPNECVQWIKNHFGQNTVHMPASEIMRLRWYLPLRQQDKVVIDGGFGEIARRQYLNRLLLKGKKALINKDSETIANHLRHHRADIFNFDTKSEMEHGYYLQLDEYIGDSPDITKFGMENWVDLLAIRTRLSNWFGFAQACVDGLATNYMPFGQKDVINDILNLPLHLRKNGKLWRNMIKDSPMDLASFPLVKGTITYPFNISTLGALAWTSAKKMAGMYYRDFESVLFIDHMKECILDFVNSENVKSYPHYDYPSIKNMIDKYFAGEKQLARQIDWWLAFELWRRSL